MMFFVLLLALPCVLSATDNQLLFKYGCDSEHCNFVIDIDEAMLNYVDRSVFDKGVSDVNNTINRFQNLEVQIAASALNFNETFTPVFTNATAAFEDVSAMAEDLNIELSAYTTNSTELVAKAATLAKRAVCFYEKNPSVDCGNMESY